MKQGNGGRTHLMSPQMAAAAAFQGCLTDVRNLPPVEAETAAAPAAVAAGMPVFNTLTSVAAPLDLVNIDTDMIIPKQFLKTIKRTGLGTALFYEMRYKGDGSTEIPDFVLNKVSVATGDAAMWSGDHGFADVSDDMTLRAHMHFGGRKLPHTNSRIRPWKVCWVMRFPSLDVLIRVIGCYFHVCASMQC